MSASALFGATAICLAVALVFLALWRKLGTHPQIWQILSTIAGIASLLTGILGLFVALGAGTDGPPPQPSTPPPTTTQPPPPTAPPPTTTPPPPSPSTSTYESTRYLAEDFRPTDGANLASDPAATVDGK